MKKMLSFKRIFAFVIGIALLCFTTNTYAVDDQITFTESSTFPNYSSILWTNYGTTYKKAKFADGTEVYAFCFNHEKDAPPVGSVLKKRSLTAAETKKINAFVYRDII